MVIRPSTGLPNRRLNLKFSSSNDQASKSKFTYIFMKFNIVLVNPIVDKYIENSPDEEGQDIKDKW